MAPAVRDARAAVTALRHRLPPALDRAFDTVRWWSPWRSDPAERPSLHHPAGRPRVLIAPANFAGQGYRWARALDAAGVPTLAWQRSLRDGFGYPADHADGSRAQGASRRWQRSVFDEVVDTVEAVVIEAGRPLFGALFGHDPVLEATALRDAGVRVATLWHGTDIRLPSVHRTDHPWSPFGVPGAGAWSAAVESVARRNRRRSALIGPPTFVSTPDLLPGLPGALWVPVVLDLPAWRMPPPARTGALVVLHLPSSRQIKGTQLVEATLRELAAEGLVDYRAPGPVPAAAVPALIEQADVVLDQFRLGIYGVAACEAMAAGRLVVSMVDPQVYRAVRDLTGRQLPIVPTTPDDLRAVVRDLAVREEPDPRAALGPEFVRAVHDGRRSAQVLAAALLG